MFVKLDNSCLCQLAQYWHGYSILNFHCQFGATILSLVSPNEGAGDTTGIPGNHALIFNNLNCICITFVDLPG